MKTKGMRLLFMIIVITSLKLVCADEFFKTHEFETLNTFDDEFDELDELDEYHIDNHHGKKKSSCYTRANERCLKPTCKLLCNIDGYKKGKCKKSKHGKVEKCYCYKGCSHKPKTPVIPPIDISPVPMPSYSPIFPPSIPAPEPDSDVVPPNTPRASPVYPPSDLAPEPVTTPTASPIYPPSSPTPTPHMPPSVPNPPSTPPPTPVSPIDPPCDADEELSVDDADEEDYDYY